MHAINAIILFLCLSSIYISFRKFGLGSFITLGLIGNFIYSIPAILGIQLTIYRIPPLITKSSAFADEIIGIIWLLLLFLVLLTPKTKYKTHINKKELLLINRAIFIASLIGLVGIFLKEGLFFIFTPRESTSLIRMLWRWSIVLGLIVSAILGKKMYFRYYFVLLMTYFISGDRTIMAIAFFSLIFVIYKFYKLEVKHYLLFLFFVILLFFGKLIYGAVHSHNMQFLLDQNSLLSVFRGFEPLVIYGNFNYVISTNLKLSLVKVIYTLFGQFLLVPSYFGINANLFNTELSKALPINLTYGIAGSFWGFAWSFGGVYGIILFTIFYYFLLFLSDYMFCKGRDIIKLISVLIGALTAIYIYRNGFINFLSFYRQIFIFSISVELIVLLQKLMIVISRNGVKYEKKDLYSS